MKYTSDMVFHVFKEITLQCTLFIWSQIVQSAITNDQLMNVLPESGYILSDCFVIANTCSTMQTAFLKKLLNLRQKNTMCGETLSLGIICL